MTAPETDKPQRSNLAVRLATSAIVVPFILWALLLGPAWVWATFVLLIAVPVAGQEMFAMTTRGSLLMQGWGIVACTLLSWLFYAATLSAWQGNTAASPYLWPDAIQLLPFALFFVVIGSLLVSLSRPVPSDEAGTRMAWLVAGPFYVGALMSPIASLHALPHGGAWVVLAMMLAWFADTGGYFAGRFLGGKIIARKMAPNISPKKTWEGGAGGVLGALLGALLAHFWYLPELSLPGALGLALLAGPLGIFGDLVESLIKRSTGTKDSGWIVPGHGGLIDRIDALMFTATATMIYARLSL
jgi:phosphatidate cytidylyltransferase